MTLDAKCLIRLRSNNKIVGNFSFNSSTNHLTMCLEKQTNMLIHWKNWEQPKLISFSKHNLPQTYLHYSFYLHFFFFSTSSLHNISLSLSLSLSLITNGEKRLERVCLLNRVHICRLICSTITCSPLHL